MRAALCPERHNDPELTSGHLLLRKPIGRCPRRPLPPPATAPAGSLQLTPCLPGTPSHSELCPEVSGLCCPACGCLGSRGLGVGFLWPEAALTLSPHAPRSVEDGRTVPSCGCVPVDVQETGTGEQQAGPPRDGVWPM